MSNECERGGMARRMGEKEMVKLVFFVNNKNEFSICRWNEGI